MGPGITASNMNAWDMFQQRSGMGEGYIYDFAIDLYWLKFLKRSNQLEEEQLVESLNLLNSGGYIGIFNIKMRFDRIS